jgi:Holliday junction resolvase RusA-like endonuclease
MNISFTIDGKPVAKQSFRVIAKKDSQGKTRKVSGYTEERVTTWQQTVHLAAHQAMDGAEPVDHDLIVRIQFILANRMRIDLDNLSKAVLDGCNEVVWKDDKQIVDLHLTKTIGKSPCAIVSVMSVQDLL